MKQELEADLDKHKFPRDADKILSRNCLRDVLSKVRDVLSKVRIMIRTSDQGCSQQGQ